jgi:HPr kinase/phosphorylase
VSKLTLHATCVSFNGTGVLIRGPSGSGKSSLALQLLESPGTGLSQDIVRVEFVSDDQTHLDLRDGHLHASPPQAIAGLLEVRGQDILQLPHVGDVPVGLVVELKSASRIERLPEAATLVTDILGVMLPCVSIDATHPSAAARVRVAWARLKKP